MSRHASPSKLYAQILRAVAAILVCWGHALFEVQAQGVPVSYNLKGRNQGFGAVGVDLFFVLSGLVVSLSAARKPEANPFLWRRLIRIVPFYWAAAAFFALFMALTSQALTKERLLYLPFVPNPFKTYSLPPYPNAWTLVNELFFYFCLYVGLRVAAHRARSVCTALVLITIAANVLSVTLLHRSVPLASAYGNPIALEFLFGMLVGSLIEHRSFSLSNSFLSMLVGSSALFATLLFGFGKIWDQVLLKFSLEAAFTRVAIWGVPCAMIVMGAASLAWNSRSPFGRGVVYLGDACYSIYLLQWLPINHLGSMVKVVGNAVGGDIAVLLLVALAILLGVAVYRYVERPLTAWAGNLPFARLDASSPLADAGIAPPEL